MTANDLHTAADTESGEVDGYGIPLPEIKADDDPDDRRGITKTIPDLGKSPAPAADPEPDDEDVDPDRPFPTGTEEAVKASVFAEKVHDYKLDIKARETAQAEHKRERLQALHGGQGSWKPTDLGPYIDGTIDRPVPQHWTRTDGIHLLYPKRVNAFFGEPEAAKTLVAIDIAAKLIINGKRILYIDYENGPEEISERFGLLGATKNQLAAHLTYVEPALAPDLDDPDWLALLDTEFDLVVIDSVTSALATFGVKSIDNDEIAAWWATFPTLIANRTKGAVILIDHVVKNSETRGRYPIGGAQKLALIHGAGYMFTTTDKPVMRGAIGQIDIRIAKDRNSKVRPHGTDYRTSDQSHAIATVTVDSQTTPGRTTIRTDPPAPDTTVHSKHGYSPALLAMMERVSAHMEGITFLAANAANPSPTRTITNLRGEVKGDNNLIGVAVRALAERGHLEHLGGRTGWKFTKPYAIADDPDTTITTTGPGGTA